MGHARALLPLPPAYQEQIGKKIISSGLSVRQAEKLASSQLNKKQAEHEALPKTQILWR